MFNDRIVVAPRADAHLRVDGTIGRGNFYLVPQLGRCPGSELGRHLAVRNAPVGAGSYEFKKDTVGRGAGAQERVALVVKNGAAVVQWNSGQLMVRALDEQIRDLGSTFTVIVDSAANRGFITVQEGLVTMRSGTRASAGQSFTFGPGQPLQQVIVRTAGLDEIRFHSDDVWQPPRAFPAIPRPPRVPVPHLPWKYIIGGTIGVSAASFAAWKLWPEKAPPPAPPVKAIIVITIPL